MTRRGLAKIAALFSVFVGFFSILFGSAVRTPGSQQGAGESSVWGEIARADAPTCGDSGSCTSCGDCGSGDSGGDSGSGKIICAELFRQGEMRADWYKADQQFGKLVPTHVLEGYYLWARPIVRLIRRSPWARSITKIIVLPWAQHMAHLMGVEPKDSFAGRIIMYIGYPICAVLGHYLAFRDRRRSIMEVR